MPPLAHLQSRNQYAPERQRLSIVWIERMVKAWVRTGAGHGCRLALANVSQFDTARRSCHLGVGPVKLVLDKRALAAPRSRSDMSWDRPALPPNAQVKELRTLNAQTRDLEKTIPGRTNTSGAATSAGKSELFWSRQAW